MTNAAAPPSSRGLRAFDLLLSLLLIGLTVASALLVPLLAMQVTGRGTLSVDGELALPYTLSTDAGSQIDVSPDGSIATRWDGPEDDDPLEGVQLPSKLRTTVDLARGDVDARLVAGIALVLLLGAAWLGLVNLRRVVRSAIAANPFDAHNVGRLRRVAAAVLSAPVVGWISVRLLEATIDVENASLSVRNTGPNWGVYVVVGLGLLALAEVFRAGAALQELEQSTI